MCIRDRGSNKLKTREEVEDHLERYFLKSELIPAIVQEASTGEVLMLSLIHISPGIEYYDVFDAEDAAIPQYEMYKSTDNKGCLLYTSRCV